jgi:hypothetical protein
MVEMLNEVEPIIDSRVCFLSDELGKLIFEMCLSTSTMS